MRVTDGKAEKKRGLILLEQKICVIIVKLHTTCFWVH